MEPTHEGTNTHQRSYETNDRKNKEASQRIEKKRTTSWKRQTNG